MPIVVHVPSSPNVDAAITAVRLSDIPENPMRPSTVNAKSNRNSLASDCSNQ